MPVSKRLHTSLGSSITGSGAPFVRGDKCCGKEGNFVFSICMIAIVISLGPAIAIFAMSLSQYAFPNGNPPYSEHTMVVMYAVCGTIIFVAYSLAMAILCCSR